MRLAGIKYDSFVDGPGLRLAIFVQGCDLGCLGCHNPESHDSTTGEEYTPQQLLRIIKKPRAGKENVRGITLSGGEPFMQAAELAIVARGAKAMGLDVVTYTGHTYESLRARTSDEGVQALLGETDYLVDGPFVAEQRNLDLRFRGSSNQRIIDMKATKESGGVVVTEFE